MVANKDRSLLTRKQAVGRRPWPNLPQPLLNSIARNPHLLQQISYPGTTKSWASPTRRHCSNSRQPWWPQLKDSGGCSKWSSLSKTLPHFINIFFKTEAYQWWYHGGNMPCNFWHRPMYFVGYSNGSLIHQGPNDPSYFEIYEVTTRIYRTLHWDVRIPIKFAALCSSPSSPTLLAVVTGISRPAIMIHRYHQDPWIKIDLQGTLAVFEEIDSSFSITAIGKSRAVPSVPSRYLKEYIFESNGEIWLALLIHQRTLTVVDKVEVFRLDIPRLSWIKLECLQEKALFLEDECCIWVKPGQVGCRRNCVYFSTQGTGTEWHIYDMESGCISAGLAAASLPWNKPS